MVTVLLPWPAFRFRPFPKGADSMICVKKKRTGYLVRDQGSDQAWNQGRYRDQGLFSYQM